MCQSRNQPLNQPQCAYRMKNPLKNNIDFLYRLERHEQDISEIRSCCPTSPLETIDPNVVTEPYEISNENLPEIRKITSSWTKSKVERSHQHTNSESFNHAESSDHEPDKTSSNSRSPSPATVNRNFVDYLVETYS